MAPRQSQSEPSKKNPARATFSFRPWCLRDSLFLPSKPFSSSQFVASQTLLRSVRLHSKSSVPRASEKSTGMAHRCHFLRNQAKVDLQASSTWGRAVQASVPGLFESGTFRFAVDFALFRYDRQHATATTSREKSEWKRSALRSSRSNCWSDGRNF